MAEYRIASTEDVLCKWRYGSTQAERLCGNLLQLDGYQSIDPQCPLGGRDGTKDAICEKGGCNYVAAVYFPPTEQIFKTIRKKFTDDLTGVKKNGCEGIIFLVNQRLTPAQRQELLALADGEGHTAQVYHLERMVALLDSPRGLGVRLEYLRIPMSYEDQMSFWSLWKNDVVTVLQQQDQSFRDLTARIDDLCSTQTTLLTGLADRHQLKSKEFKPFLLMNNNGIRRVDFGPAGTLHLTSEADSLVLLTDSAVGRLILGSGATAHLTLDIMFAIHRAVVTDYDVEGLVGKLRKRQCWIGSPGSTIEDATYVPPAPDQVPHLIDELLSNWNSEYAEVRSLSDEAKYDRIADFHHGILSIHPFEDGNGRVARVLLLQQANDLLGEVETLELPESAVYHAALQTAHDGDLTALRELIHCAFVLRD